jgi:hypothetical protein
MLNNIARNSAPKLVIPRNIKRPLKWLSLMASAAVQSVHIVPNLFQNEFNPSTAVSSENKTQSDLHDVLAVLNYYKEKEDGSPPDPSYAGKPETFFRPAAPLETTVHDLRGTQANYTLDKNGFQIYNHRSQEKDFVDEEAIKTAYYSETEQLLKDVTGASKVYIFDHTIRRPSKDADADKSTSLRGPVQRVHIDQSYSAAKTRVTHHFPEEGEKLLKGRYQIINVWRPIKPIYKDPLAVADAGSVPDSDLVPVALIYPNRQGETYTVKPNTQHQWYYLYGQSPEEVTLIKCFDSKTDGRARRVPHTAFVNPETVDREARESIEVRALVFHEDDAE